MALAQLKKRGWVGEDHNRFLLLTEEGNRIANLVEHNYVILSKFFEVVLGVEKDIALGDACKMEHLMSTETGQRLLWLMKYLLSNEKPAVKVRESMAAYNGGCAPHDKEECPICGTTGECLVDAGSSET